MLFDIGIGEILVIGVLALVVFGPDRLPKAIADLARLLRQLRATAAAAKEELTVAAGLQPGGEMQSVVSDLRDLDPRRIIDLPELAELTDLEGPSVPGPATGPTPGRGAAKPGVSEPQPAKSEAPQQVDPDWL